jgi:hypothetical protein
MDALITAQLDLPRDPNLELLSQEPYYTALALGCETLSSRLLLIAAANVYPPTSMSSSMVIPALRRPMESWSGNVLAYLVPGHH